MMWEIISLLAAAAVHEAGHLTAARIIGVKKISFTLKNLGGILNFDFSKTTYAGEIIVHLSGGLAGLLSSLAAYCIFSSSEYTYIGASLTFAFVNFLPIRGFDGGGILNAVLSSFMLPDYSYKICRIASDIAVFVFLTTVIWIEIKIYPNLGLLYFALTAVIQKLCDDTTRI